jgi:hypothetical protein
MNNSPVLGLYRPYASIWGRIGRRRAPGWFFIRDKQVGPSSREGLTPQTISTPDAIPLPTQANT